MRKHDNSIPLVLCGGHAATTALATIYALRTLETSVLHFDLHFIGASTAIEGKKVATLEQKVFPGLGVRLHAIYSGKLSRRFSIWAIVSFCKIPFGFIHAFFLLLLIRPKAILSFGGYSALPLVIVGKLLGISTVLHEQTLAVGLANKVSGFFVDRVALARRESTIYFPKNKCIVVGNPLQPSILKVSPKTHIGKPPVLFIMGGSRGSQIINSVIKALLPKLTGFEIYHQTGSLDFDSFSSLASAQYHPYSFIDPQEIGSFYEKADIIIGRSGANTVSELLQVKRPSILIPIPWTRFDEQTKNALYAKSFGVARIIHQDDLTVERLYKAILSIESQWKTIVKSMGDTSITHDRDASIQLAKLLVSLVS
jgi:UDP-N-acetylglucosamine--N-acetylmuramyl-(pentapeptide) pyrophosphoryl-undecaprenol N-acetylglucosamine transferase